MKTHIVTLSFDDGFKKSSFLVAEIYESFGMRACFNVIATGDRPGFAPEGGDGKPDAMAEFPRGSFDDWNVLQKRGHEVACHSYDHRNLTTLPLDEAKADIERCIEEFNLRLDGFSAANSVYNFAYNMSDPDLDAFALSKFLVVRTQGQTAVNPIPTKRRPVRVGCWSYGPDNCDAFLAKSIDDFLASKGGWFVFNLHGLDGEGWGPVSASCLRSLLARLAEMEHVEVLPAGAVVTRLTSE